MWGFPNPIDWALDELTGFLGDAAATGFQAIIGGLVAWVVDAVVWVVGGVFNFFLDASDPNVQADWFAAAGGPFTATVGIGIALLVLFVFAGIIQGVLSGDVGGMLRRFVLDLPLSVLGMVSIVTVTQISIRATDGLSMGLIDRFQDDVNQFGTTVASLQALSGGTATAFVVFLLGLATALAGLVLVAELAIRAALIYIVVALSPLVFAARLWPATRGATRKLLELLAALIVSKLVIAIALAIAAAAAVGAGGGGEVSALPAPEVFAEDPQGSTTQAVGILLTAAVTFGVAAYAPFLVARLLPLTEAALVAQGLRGAPVRAGHQAMMLTNSAHLVATRHLTHAATATAQRTVQRSTATVASASGQQPSGSPGPPATPRRAPAQPTPPKPADRPGDRDG
jgi:hypothetical protein